jgi:hypothetical protein
MTDDNIREALLRVADRAPHPINVTAAIADRSRAHRQRRALLTAGAAAGVAAVAATAVSAVTLTRPRGGASTAAGPTTAAGQSTPPGTLPSPEPAPRVGNSWTAMKYRPTWLPENVGEVSRRVTVSGAKPGRQSRTWQVRDSTRGANVVLESGPPSYFDVKGWQPTTVGGAEGWVETEVSGKGEAASKAAKAKGAPAPSRPAVSMSRLVWKASAGEWLGVIAIIRGGNDAAAVARRVAESVVPDGATGCELFLSFGWLPEGAGGELAYEVMSMEGTWSATLTLDGGGHGIFVDATVSEETGALPDTERVTLRGRTGEVRMLGRKSSGQAHVAIGHGRGMVVSFQDYGSHDVSQADLVRIVDELRVGPNPYLGWINAR